MVFDFDNVDESYFKQWQIAYEAKLQSKNVVLASSSAAESEFATVFLRDEDAGWKRMLVTPSEFKKYMCKPKWTQNWPALHEVFPPGYPIRLVADCDEKDVEGDGSEQELRLQQFICDIRMHFSATFGERDIGECIIVDATKLPRKFSAHVVFPDVWFASSGDVGRFLEGISKRYPPSYIDMNIYSDTACKSLRLPYCAKPSDPNRALIPRGCIAITDWKMVMRCSASCVISDPPNIDDCLTYGAAPARSLQMNLANTKFMRVTTVSSGNKSASPNNKETCEIQVPFKLDEHRMKCIENTLQYLRDAYGNFNPICGFRFDEKGNWKCMIDTPLFCHEKYAQGDTVGFHHSNKSYIGSDGNRLYMWCSDPVCRKDIYFHEDVSYLLTGKKVTQ